MKREYDFMRVILVEDDADVREAVAQSLELGGYQVEAFECAQGLESALSTDFQGVVVTDIRLPGRDGRQLFRDIQRIDSELPVILISGHGELQEAVDLMREGAYDFISKPFAAPRLLASVRNALEHRNLVLDNRRLRLPPRRSTVALPLLGESDRIVHLRSLIRELSTADVPVLIIGETGTGKEFVARALHEEGRRKRNSFVTIDCAALPEHLLDSELFGSATILAGMTRRSPGRLEAAEGGTLFLDNIDNLTQTGQAKLLRVVEDKSFVLPGSSTTVKISCRIVCAATKPLSTMVASNQFRSDLFFRINTVTLQLPPLRERREDISALFVELLVGASSRLKKPTPTLTKRVKRHLFEHSWPGNIRELSHFADRIVLGIDQQDSVISESVHDPLPEIVERFEASLIKNALRSTAGSVKDCLELLKIPRKTFYDKVARHHINLDEFRGSD